MKITPRRVWICLGTVVLGLVVWFCYQLFGPSPQIVVSKQTTWLTQPLAGDGLPDYATWLLDQQRAGVTPETNAAIPFLEAMWPAEIEPAHQSAICAEIGMDLPDGPRFVDLERLGTTGHPTTVALAVALLRSWGLEPPGPIASETDLRDWGLEWKKPEDFAGLPPAMVELLQLDPEFEWDESPQELALTAAELLTSRAMQQPWSSADLPALATWIDSNTEGYDLLHEAARRPHYYCPSYSLLAEPNTTLIAMLFPDIQTLRQVVRLLAYRSMWHLGEGDVAAAWNDCQAMFRFAQLVPDETIIGQLVAIACSGIATEVATAILASPDCDAATARAMREWLTSHPSTMSMARAVDVGERLMMVTTILNFSGARQAENQDPTDSIMGDATLDATARANVDWNVVLMRLNRFYDRIAETMQLDDYQQRQEAAAQIEAELDELLPSPTKLLGSLISRNVRSEAIADVFAGLLLPAVGAAREAQNRHDTKLVLLVAAAALAEHRAEQGAYPDKLDAVVGKYLAQPPVDGYRGLPLEYRKTDNGYLLYSVGANGQDDRGSHHYGWLEGYEIDNNERAIRQQLGLEPAGPDDDLLESTIPEDADDWAIRVPPLEQKWPQLSPESTPDSDEP